MSAPEVVRCPCCGQPPVVGWVVVRDAGWPKPGMIVSVAESGLIFDSREDAEAAAKRHRKGAYSIHPILAYDPEAFK